MKDRLILMTSPIRAWRIEQRKTIQPLAEDIGVSKEAWRRWETGEDIPRDMNLAALATMMGRKIPDLLADLQKFQRKAKRAMA